MPVGYATVRTTFEEVRRASVKTVPCSVCGRKIRRQKTLTMTINPWNVNPDGTQRTREEIWEALAGKIAVWQAEPEKHEKCVQPLSR